MDHAEATSQLAVERYLLGELGPEARDAFEEHFFDCEECSTELRAMTLFLSQAKQELALPIRNVSSPETKRKLFSFSSLLRPAFAVPAMAAMLLVIGFQNTVTFPHLKNEAAIASHPQILPSVSLVDGGSRSGEMRTVTVDAGQPFLLFVDVPSESRFSAYLCSLYSPSGKLVSQITVASAQASDTVSIQIPPSVAQAGVNTLVVQGVPPAAEKSAAVDLVHYRFLLQIR
jgi:hypothetical protein